MTRDVSTPTYPARSAYAPWPFMLSLIGGALILIEGIIVAIAGPILATAGDLGFGALLYGIIVMILGLIIILEAYSIRAYPTRHVAYGAAIIIFSVIALVLAGGGFIIGSVLGMIGGAWAIVRA